MSNETPAITRKNSLKKAFSVFIVYIALRIAFKCLVIRKMHPLRMLLFVGRIGAVADGVVRIEVHVIDTPVVGGQGSDHFVLLLPQKFLLVKLFLERAAVRKLTLSDGVLCLLLLELRHDRDIHAQAQTAQPAGLIGKLHLRGLEMSRIPGCVRHIFDENMRNVHRQRKLVVLGKVSGRHRIKYFKIRKTDDPLRTRFVRIFGKGLVARQVDPARRVLLKDHRRHIREQR